MSCFFPAICVFRYISVFFVANGRMKALKIPGSVFSELWFSHSPCLLAAILAPTSLSQSQ